MRLIKKVLLLSDFNDFNELESKNIEETGGVPEFILKDLQNSIKFMKLAGDCIDVFIPKFLGALSSVIGTMDSRTGDEQKKDDLFN